MKKLYKQWEKSSVYRDWILTFKYYYVNKNWTDYIAPYAPNSYKNKVLNSLFVETYRRRVNHKYKLYPVNETNLAKAYWKDINILNLVNLSKVYIWNDSYKIDFGNRFANSNEYILKYTYKKVRWRGRDCNWNRKRFWRSTRTLTCVSEVYKKRTLDLRSAKYLKNTNWKIKNLNEKTIIIEKWKLYAWEIRNYRWSRN